MEQIKSRETFVHTNLFLVFFQVFRMWKATEKKIHLVSSLLFLFDWLVGSNGCTASARRPAGPDRSAIPPRNVARREQSPPSPHGERAMSQDPKAFGLSDVGFLLGTADPRAALPTTAEAAAARLPPAAARTGPSATVPSPGPAADGTSDVSSLTAAQAAELVRGRHAAGTRDVGRAVRRHRPAAGGGGGGRRRKALQYRLLAAEMEEETPGGEEGPVGGAGGGREEDEKGKQEEEEEKVDGADRGDEEDDSFVRRRAARGARKKAEAVVIGRRRRGGAAGGLGRCLRLRRGAREGEGEGAGGRSREASLPVVVLLR